MWDVLENTIPHWFLVVFFTGFRSWCQATSVSRVGSRAPFNVSSRRTSWIAVCLETWLPSQGSLKCPMKKVRDIVHTVNTEIFRKLVLHRFQKGMFLFNNWLILIHVVSQKWRLNKNNHITVWLVLFLLLTSMGCTNRTASGCLPSDSFFAWWSHSLCREDLCVKLLYPLH